MKRSAVLLLLAFGPALAQEIKFPANFEALAKKASEAVDVSLEGSLLQLAGKFLSASDPDEARVKNILQGLKGIYVKSFEFDKEGEYSSADVDAIRSQLRRPAWTKMVGVISKHDRENAEVFVRAEGNRLGGLVIVCTEPRELTIVNIIGSIDLDQLSELGGHFGIPSIDVSPEKKPAKD